MYTKKYNNHGWRLVSVKCNSYFIDDGFHSLQNVMSNVVELSEIWFLLRQSFSGYSGFLRFSGFSNEMKTLAFIGTFEKHENLLYL